VLFRSKQKWKCVDFAKFFAEGKPRLVFLQLCQPQTMQANFAVLAPEFINIGIPTVIATQYPINPKDAKKFTMAFYRTLAQGESIDTAVTEGRQTLFRTNPTYFLVVGSPVLYLNTWEDKMLIPAPEFKGTTGTVPGEIPLQQSKGSS